MSMVVPVWVALPLVVVTTTVVVVFVAVLVGVERSGPLGEADVPVRAAVWMGVDVTAVAMAERDLVFHEAER